MAHQADQKAIQDNYPDQYNYCYGCGRLNDHGLKITSYWDGNEGVCTFTPQPYHISFPGFVYGGLIASLVDCHSIGTAAAATYHAEGRAPGSEPLLRFLTASLKVDFLRPTPLGIPLEVRAFATEIKGRKVVVHCRVLAGEQECARGEVVAVRAPEDW